MGSSLLVRNLADGVKTELRVRAARNGRSMEEEARLILAAALAPPVRAASDGLPWSLGEATRMIFGPENGVELTLPPDEPIGDPPDLGWPMEDDEERGGPANGTGP